jgi:hypothetical protein
MDASEYPRSHCLQSTNIIAQDFTELHTDVTVKDGIFTTIHGDMNNFNIIGKYVVMCPDSSVKISSIEDRTKDEDEHHKIFSIAEKLVSHFIHSSLLIYHRSTRWFHPHGSLHSATREFKRSKMNSLSAGSSQPQIEPIS